MRMWVSTVLAHVCICGLGGQQMSKSSSVTTMKMSKQDIASLEKLRRQVEKSKINRIIIFGTDRDIESYKYWLTEKFPDIELIVHRQNSNRVASLRQAREIALNYGPRTMICEVSLGAKSAKGKKQLCHRRPRVSTAI